MRVRALLGIAALVVVAGCQAGPTTAAGPMTTTRSTGKTTTTTPPRYTPKPDGSTPHHTIRFRLDIVDGDSHLILIPVTSNPSPVHDPTPAKQLRQDPAVATDAAAQQRAAASLDCGQPDPLTGQDDPSLPLVTCGGGDDATFLGPAVLDGSMIAGASYSRGGPLPNRWDVTVDFTPAGSKILAETAPKNVNRLLGMLFDGDLAASTILTEKSVGSLVFTVQTEDDARQLAAIINNR